jgi:hypothetical protein
MFGALEEINARPAPFEHCTVADLWTDEHRSSRMLDYHLNGSVDLSSGNLEFIRRSVTWIVSRFQLTLGKSGVDGAAFDSESHEFAVIARKPRSA